MATNPQGAHPSYQQEHLTRVETHLAATATELKCLYIAERACRVKSVFVVPDAAVTGQDTNTTHLNVLHEATEKANLDLVNGTDLTTNAKQSLYAPTTPLALAAGEMIHLQIQKVGTGLLLPSMLAGVVVDFGA